MVQRAAHGWQQTQEMATKIRAWSNGEGGNASGTTLSALVFTLQYTGRALVRGWVGKQVTGLLLLLLLLLELSLSYGRQQPIGLSSRKRIWAHANEALFSRQCITKAYSTLMTTVRRVLCVPAVHREPSQHREKHALRSAWNPGKTSS